MEEIKSIYTLVYCGCLKNNAINQSIQLCTFYTCIFIDIPWCAMYYQCCLISEFNSTTSINNIFRMLLIFNYYWTYYIPIIPVFFKTFWSLLFPQILNETLNNIFLCYKKQVIFFFIDEIFNNCLLNVECWIICLDYTITINL